MMIYENHEGLFRKTHELKAHGLLAKRNGEQPMISLPRFAGLKQTFVLQLTCLAQSAAQISIVLRCALTALPNV